MNIRHYLLAFFVICSLGACTHQHTTLLLPEKMVLPLELIYVNQVDPKFARNAFESARERLLHILNIELHVSRERHMQATFPPSSPADFLLAWRNKVTQNPDSDGKLSLLFFSQLDLRQALLNEVRGYSEGLGFAVTQPKSLAFVGVCGFPYQDGSILLHELGHLFGAAHSSEGLMREGDLFTNPEGEFSAQSLAEIRATIQAAAASDPNSVFHSQHSNLLKPPAQDIVLRMYSKSMGRAYGK